MKMSFLFFILLFSSASFAEDCKSCGPQLNHGNEIEKQISGLSRLAEVNCRDVLEKDTDDEYKRNYSKDPVKSATVGGLKLQGTADELKFLGLMLDKKPANEWSKAKDCSTVLCALGKVYQSETTAKRVLNIAKRNGYIVSLSKDFTNEESKPIGQIFSPQEVETIDLAYKRLPANFSKLKTLDRLKRMPDGYKSPRSPNAAAYASPGFKSSYYSSEGEITFISSSFDSDNTWASSVAVHELSHHLDFSRPGKNNAGYSESDEFLKLSGWKLEKSYTTDKAGKKVLQEKWTRPDTKNFVRDYAGTEPAEDFAEAVAYYVYEPNKLRQTDPEKYNFIKNKVFAGQEFDKVLENMITKEELIKSCASNTKSIELRGYGKMFGDSYFTNCLGETLSKLMPATPEQCFHHKDIIKSAAMDQINPEIEKMRADVIQCDSDLKKNKAACIAEGDLRKSCAVTKCNLKPDIQNKVKDSSYYAGDYTALRDAMAKKLTPGSVVMAAITGGLKEKKVDANYPLYYQQAFLTNATAELKNSLDKAGFKFDEDSKVQSSLQSELMQNKTYNRLLDSFQQKVLKNAGKSKEKNLELIKDWARSESVDEAEIPEDLAEKLSQQGKGLFSR